jgi:hypothetical protein
MNRMSENPQLLPPLSSLTPAQLNVLQDACESSSGSIPAATNFEEHEAQQWLFRQSFLQQVHMRNGYIGYAPTKAAKELWDTTPKIKNLLVNAGDSRCYTTFPAGELLPAPDEGKPEAAAAPAQPGGSDALSSEPIAVPVEASSPQDVQSQEASSHSSRQSSSSSSSSSSRRPKYDWLAKAMLLVNANPDWSDAKIAKEVGIHPSQLSRSLEYQGAAALARGKKTDLPSGHYDINPDTGARTLEAYSSDDDPAEMDWDDDS